MPLEEWPTYIFTRTFAQRSGTKDMEIAALKAVAKHHGDELAASNRRAAVPKAK